jgi:hypothetical protein
MRIYSVRFRKYDDSYHRNTVSRIIQGKKETIKLPQSVSGEYLVPEFDLQEYESFGNGYEMARFIGELDDSYFTGSPAIPRTVVDVEKKIKMPGTTSFQGTSPSSSE